MFPTIQWMLFLYGHISKTCNNSLYNFMFNAAGARVHFLIALPNTNDSSSTES